MVFSSTSNIVVISCEVDITEGIVSFSEDVIVTEVDGISEEVRVSGDVSIVVVS